MAQSTPATRTALFRRVYQEAQRTIGGLLTPLLRTLEELGCGPRGSLEVFEPKARQVIAGFAHDPPGAPQFTSLRVSVTPQVRAGLIANFLFSLGIPKEAAEAGAKTMVGIPREQMLQTGKTWGTRATRTSINTPAARMFIALRGGHRRAKDLHERLSELRTTVNEPYAADGPRRKLSGRNNTASGRRAQNARYADLGVEQTVELLEMFPDLADGVYQRAGLRGLAGFPPRPTAGAFEGDTAEFANNVEEHLSDEATWAIVSAVALIAAGVVLTVVTVGVAGPLVGMAAGATLGLAQGGVHVANASSDLALARDGHRVGAVSEQRLAFLEGEVQGAWGMLLVDVATGGLLGRFGGAGNVGKVAQAFRTMAISGAGTGVGTATNPNVWDSPDVAAVLLKATVIGTVAGGAGAAAGSGLSRAGNRLMIGLSRRHGELKAGARVTLSTKDADAGGEMMGEVVSVHGDNVRISTPHGQVNYKINDVALVRTADGSPAATVAAEPPVSSRRQVANDTAPRVQSDDAPSFDRVADVEKPYLGNADVLAAKSPEELSALSKELMPQVQAQLEKLGYRARPITVDNESGGSHMALELLEAPGRMGTMMRRAGPTMGSDVRYIYDPVGLRRDGGAGLFDADINAMRIGHPMMAFGHRGVMSPFFHELRHGRTMMRLGDASYPFHGKLFFGQKSEMSMVSSDYRDQFQIDEMYAYLKQAGSFNSEARRANHAVAQGGRTAVQDPRVGHSFAKAPGEGDAYRARDFARAVKEQVGDMHALMQRHKTRVSTKVEHNDGQFDSTIHTYKDESGKPVLKIEYFDDGQGTNALVVKEQFDNAGKAVDETHVVLQYVLPNAPRGYTGDATHSLVAPRMQSTLAATDEVIAKSLGLRNIAQAQREEAREIWSRAQ